MISYIPITLFRSRFSGFWTDIESFFLFQINEHDQGLRDLHEIFKIWCISSERIDFSSGIFSWTVPHHDAMPGYSPLSSKNYTSAKIKNSNTKQQKHAKPQNYRICFKLKEDLYFWETKQKTIVNIVNRHFLCVNCWIIILLYYYTRGHHWDSVVKVINIFPLFQCRKCTIMSSCNWRVK